MKNSVLGILLLLFSLLKINAQNNITIKVLSETENEPLFGATVYFNTLNKGAITNTEGIANFTDLPDGVYTATISYLGFESLKTSITIPTSKQLVFYLNQTSNQLEEVIVESSRTTRTIQKIPTRVEFIGGEELSEKNMMNSTNISMVLRESTGIQMQQTSLSSGNMSIRIQGLDGRYTQLLRDGFPLYSGYSGGLSIMQIPPLDLKQFEIIKGSSSTLYGGGAIAGLVNLISKTPDFDPDLSIMLTQTHALGSTANVFYSNRNEKFGVTMYASGNYQKQYDPEDDGFSNLPKTKSISFNPKVFYYPTNKTSMWFGVNATYDSRIGGDIEAIKNPQNNSNRYTEKNVSKRLSTQAFFKSLLSDNKKITFKNSLSWFDRSLTVPDYNFSGEQINTFTEATYQIVKKNIDWTLGANLYTTNFNESNSTVNRNQNDVTVGLFANNILDFSESWILETGFRVDYAKDWGFFVLPRASLLYKNNKGFSSRIGGGLGYKIPDMFTEETEFVNFKNVMPINKNSLKPERSYGLNLDFNYETILFNTIGFSVNQLFYLTTLENGLLLNSLNEDEFVFENAPDNITTKGAETNIKFTYKHFRWFLNYALIDTRLTYLPGKPQKPLTAKHNAGSVLMYETPKWRIGFETYYTGKQFLSNREETPDYITMGFLVMRGFDWGDLFLNFENFTDRRQSRFAPLVSPPYNNPVFSEIYAPTDGFIFSIGITLKPFGNNKEHH